MTGRELEKYLMSLGQFKTHDVYIVDIVDGEVDGMVPSFYKMYIPMSDQYEIKISYGDEKGSRLVEFKLDKINLYNIYRLDQLDFSTLEIELQKIFNKQGFFLEWSRNHKINNILETSQLIK